MHPILTSVTCMVKYTLFPRPATHRPLKSHQNKRDIEGETKASPARTLEILELPDLKKEYLMLDARLRLIRHQPDTALVSGGLLLLLLLLVV